MTDVWLSNAVGHPHLMTRRDDIPFPMDEIEFLELDRKTCGPPSSNPMLSSSSSSLFTQMVKLNTVHMDISTMNQSSVKIQSSMYDTGEHNVVQNLSERLDNWYQILPPQLLDTQEHLARYEILGLGGAFTAVYLGYYQYRQLLYYRYLHEDCFDNTSRSHARHYANKCKEASTALCEILYRAYSTPHCNVYYTMVGHVLVVASTIQLHILLFSADIFEVDAARARLERNFEILTKLQSLWPTLDVCFLRFRGSHKACQKYMEPSFRMDRWMLQFLFEFAKPVNEEDRDDFTDFQPLSIEDLGI